MRWVVLGLVLLLGITFAWFRRPMSLERHAARLASCWAGRDVACLLEYADAQDRQAYRLDKRRMKLLVDEAAVVLGDPTGPPQIVREPGGTFVMASIDHRPGNRRRQSVGLVVTRTPEGYRSPQMVGAILLAMAAAAHLPPTGEVDGVAKLRAWAEQADQDGPRLTRLGFPGVLRDSDEGLVAWADWAAYNRRRLASVEQAQSRR